VGDHQVVARPGGCGEASPSCGRREVCGNGLDACGLERREGDGVAVAADDLGAAAAQQLGDRAADPACGAGDGGAPAGEVEWVTGRIRFQFRRLYSI
jgi:hypothetical protein